MAPSLLRREDAGKGVLADGSVLVAEGNYVTAYPSTTLATAELYHAATGLFALTGTMTSPRVAHTATLLVSGEVLVAGGYASPCSVCGPIGSAEFYNEATGGFTAVATNMTSPRANHTATRLEGGSVLVVGGSQSTATDIFDATTGLFVVGPTLNTNRAFHTATLLQDGTVLVTGGLPPPSSFPTASAEIAR